MVKWNKLSPERLTVLEVDVDLPMSQFVCRNGLDFKTGKRFYELTKREKIQDYKEILLMDKSTSDVFEVEGARKLLGVPKQTCTLKPSDLNHNILSKYIVFIQTTSVNRKLIEGTKFLYKDGCIQLSLFPNSKGNS